MILFLWVECALGGITVCEQKNGRFQFKLRTNWKKANKFILSFDNLMKKSIKIPINQKLSIQAERNIQKIH